MIDLHTHVLPGVDDGARTIEESVSMLAGAAAEGVRAVVATPHVRDDYPTSADEMDELVARVRDAARGDGVPVDVLPGGELALDRAVAMAPEELRRFGLGGNANVLLVEFPYYGWPATLARDLGGMRAAGFRVVLAHPERNAEVQAAPVRLEPLVASGVVVQLTASSVTGALGRAAKDAATRLLELGLAHCVASDMHANVPRSGLGAAAAAVGDGALADWLTSAVPHALVGGDDLPPRPVRRRWFGRR